MSIYDQDPDTGLPRPPLTMDPVTDDQITSQRAQAVRALAARAHVRKTWRRREPDLARATETELTRILTGASS